MTHRTALPAFLLTITAGALLWSAIHPYDRLTWLLEVAPILVALSGAMVSRLLGRSHNRQLASLRQDLQTTHDHVPESTE